MMDLVLIHRKSLPEFSPNFPYALWKTCLRQVAILPQEVFDTKKNILNIHENDQIFYNEGVFTLLLELCCGLHSPILGETEVQGQFRNFFLNFKHENKAFEHAVNVLFQRVLEKAKRIRSEFLINTGSRSYGSFIRKLCKDKEKVAILGSGSLAKDIFPWIKNKTTIVARIPENVDIPEANISSYLDETHVDVVVVAAPLSDSEIKVWLAKQTFTGDLIDLRGKGVGDTMFIYESCKSILRLQDFFKYAKEKNDDDHLLREKVSAEIKKIADDEISRRHAKVVCRPFGWDDVCA